MRNRLIFPAIFSVILSLSALAAAQNSRPKVQAQIRNTLLNQQASWNRGDLEEFMAGYWNSPDLTFYSGSNIARGWQAALDRYRKSYQGENREMGQLEFSDLDVQPLASDAAFVRGAWKLTLKDGKTPHGLFTLIFRKFPQGWRIIHDHTSAAESTTVNPPS